MAAPRQYWYVSVAWAVIASLAACDNAKSPDAAGGQLSGRVTVDGSATVYPLSQAMAAAFRGANPAVHFAIEFSGTGGGFEKFCAGQADIEGRFAPDQRGRERADAKHSTSIH